MSQCQIKIKSPVGELTLVANDQHLLAILWEDHKAPPVPESLDHPILKLARAQLEEYFTGQRKIFDLPVRFEGTQFQNKIWKMLQKIPFGETWTYSELARAVGSPKACRAAGAANGKNPLSIVVPCHRVIGKSGTLTGFAGGLENKARLLALEARCETAYGETSRSR